ncbi:MAG: hypothetical protein HQ509_07315 [Candidatus Marinimicrobia bacterium]|nr:hypothetical protein [Candidatus Neomarinimicrobiota bacterium]
MAQFKWYRFTSFKYSLIVLSYILIFLFTFIPETVSAQDAEEIEYIDSDDCIDCHELSKYDTDIKEDISHSIHEDLECLDCHEDLDYTPHEDGSTTKVGCDGCRSCHEDESEEYQAHGRAEYDTCEDTPQCMDCHGDHDILPSDMKLSKTHPSNLPQTCGVCHENIDLVKEYGILKDHPVEIYENSVHGVANLDDKGNYEAGTCNDCHSTEGTAHKIYSPNHAESAINHFNIPATCGQCHDGIEKEYNEGIHGILVARGDAESPVCTHCHGEHGIISPDDPRSPVSSTKLAEATCTPCHQSETLNEDYGIATGQLRNYVDSYHGLKTKSGDTHVANCASCHGVHRILPSSDSTSTIFVNNLQTTCGECHPGITSEIANVTIHGEVQDNRHHIAIIVEKIYILLIIVVIGSMVIHWLIDLFRQIIIVMTVRPQVRRMRVGEVWQHTFLMVSFMILVVSGFALRFDQAWISTFFFGWEGGFEFRGLLHRITAVVFILTVLWHCVYFIFTKKGRLFLKDMLPIIRDFHEVINRVKYNLGLRKDDPKFTRFSYIEKAEYWALVWGTAVMIGTGFMLWFDNWFIHFIPMGALDVALVIHYWEAWLAFLAIVIWHMYATVFSPHVYPMNPSWLTGTMPEEMYKHEHPDHLEEAKAEEKAFNEEKRKRFREPRNK